MKTYLIMKKKWGPYALKRLPLLLVLCLALLSTGLSLGMPGSASPQNNDFIWAKRMGNTGDDRGYSVFVDGLGNVYTTGSFSGTVDFDPGLGTANLTSAGNEDIFVSKLDISGNLVWARALGGIGSDRGTSLYVDSSSNVYTTGWFSGSADFDPSPDPYYLESAGMEDIFVSRLDSSGDFVWAKHMGGEDCDRGNGIFVDGAGSVFTTGYFRSTADFDPGESVVPLSSNGYMDIFVSKLDSSGEYLWAWGTGDVLLDEGRSIFVSDQNRVYTTGYFYENVDFDPGSASFVLGSAGFEDAFIWVLESTGDFLWAGRMGGTGHDLGNSIFVDSERRVFTTGAFELTVDFDPGENIHELTSSGLKDVFVSVLDSAHQYVWSRRLGGDGNDEGYGIFVETTDGVYTVGDFSVCADFDPGEESYNLFSNGLTDIFVSKLNYAGDFVWAYGMGDGFWDYGRGIFVDGPMGDVYTAGSFSNIIDFDPGPGTYNLTSAGLWDIFVSKLGKVHTVFLPLVLRNLSP